MGLKVVELFDSPDESDDLESLLSADRAALGGSVTIDTNLVSLKEFEEQSYQPPAPPSQQQTLSEHFSETLAVRKILPMAQVSGLSVKETCSNGRVCKFLLPSACIHHVT